MRDFIREIFRKTARREPSFEEIEAIADIAQLSDCSRNDPAIVPIIISFAGNNALDKIYDVAGSLHEKILKAGDEQVAICEARVKSSTELLGNIVIRELVPQLAKKVSEAAAEKIAEADAAIKKKLNSWKSAFACSIAVVVVLGGVIFGIFLGRHIVGSPEFQLAGASVAANSLLEAIKSNQNQWFVRKLISAGVNPNIKTLFGGETALFLAVSQNAEIDVIRALIEGGADVNAVNRSGKTALISALEFNSPSLAVIELLIKNGADVNTQFNAYFENNRKGGTILPTTITPLILAAAGKNPETIAVLVKAGAKVDFADKNGFTALDYAKGNPALKDKTEVLKMLGQEDKKSPKKK